MKKNNNIMSLVFFVLIAIVPQLGYASHTVQGFNVMQEISNEKDSDIKMVAMGMNKLRDGTYRLNLLLENKSEPYAKLKDNFVLVLVDDEGNEKQVKITDITSDKCPGFILSKGCMITVTTEEIADGEVGKYGSYSVTVPYRNERDSLDKVKVFEGDMPELEVRQGLGDMSVVSGVYILSIKNIGGKNIRIKDKEIYLKSKCINLKTNAADDDSGINLSPGSSYEIEFELSEKVENTSRYCEEYITVVYNSGGDDRVAIVPIEIKYDNSGWGFRDYFFGTTAVVATAFTVYMALYGGAAAAVPAGLAPAPVVVPMTVAAFLAAKNIIQRNNRFFDASTNRPLTIANVFAR